MVGIVGFEPTLNLGRNECDCPIADIPMATDDLIGNGNPIGAYTQLAKNMT